MSPEVVRLEKHPASTPMQVFTSSRAGEPLGTIGIPCRDHINARTVMSLLTTDLRFAIEQQKTIPIVVLQGNALPWQRNELVNRMQGDWLLFIDDDMTWQPDAIARLVATQQEHDLDIVSGLCFRRVRPFHPTMYMREQPDEGLYAFREKWDEGEIVEVDATGMAFCLIHKRVFEMIADGPIPPFEERMAIGGPPPLFFHWYGTVGEDLDFCQTARKAGAKIWVDTSIQIGHVGEIEIGMNEYLHAMASRDVATVAAWREQNDKLGLPTMTAEEARERLGWQ